MPKLLLTLNTVSCIFLASYHFYEKQIAKMLLSIDKKNVPWGNNNSQELIPEIEQKLGILLADNQKEAIIKALSKRLMVITGGPGTGKTTLVKALLKLLALKNLLSNFVLQPVEPLNA